MRYDKDYRESATRRLQENMLETWQPLPVLAIRAGITDKLAASILTEMADKGSIVKISARIDGHNSVAFYKKNKYVRVFGLKLGLKNMDVKND